MAVVVLPHTFYAEAGGARALVRFAPMQFEGFQREVGEPTLERVLPPPAEGHPDMAHSPPSPSETGSKSSAHLGRLPATDGAVWNTARLLVATGGRTATHTKRLQPHLQSPGA
jgi:hypothetical protein